MAHSLFIPLINTLNVSFNIDNRAFVQPVFGDYLAVVNMGDSQKCESL